jgi:hypothetical protein
MPTITGGCHCGLVRFEAKVPQDAELLDCNCSICTMTGYLHLIVPDSDFRLTEGQRETITYRFGSGKARHIFCGQCGIKSFYRPRSHPDGVSITWRCVDEGHGLDPKIVPFDGRDWEKGKAALK